MKLRRFPRPFRFFAATLLTLTAVVMSFSQDDSWSVNRSPLPAPTGFVNDYAGVIDDSTKQALETKLKEFKDKYGVEIAVAVVKTTGDRPIFEYSLAVARGWGIGSKEDDNPGALLFVAIDDRKYFTQVSKDLEDELPDGIAGNLQRQFLVPEFRKGNYAKGISDTVDAYLYTIESRRSGVAIPTPSPKAQDSGGVTQSALSVFCCLALVIFVIVIIAANRSGGKSKNDQDRWGGGGFGGGGGVLPWIILGGSSGSSSGSSSSSWDWGGSSGGSDWGGFGGGGDFGGGGAGGDW